MNAAMRLFNAVGGRLMARSGRIGILVTTGAKTGRPRSAPLGFAARPDGSILVAAGGTGRAWVVNLAANPEATFRIKAAAGRYRARLLKGPEREAALAEFLAKQGPWGRADWREVFLLEPAATGA